MASCKTKKEFQFEFWLIFSFINQRNTETVCTTIVLNETRLLTLFLISQRPLRNSVELSNFFVKISVELFTLQNLQSLLNAVGKA